MHKTLEPLKIFLGHWNMQGMQLKGPVGPEASVTAADRYEVLQGGHFLVHHFEGKVGENDASCLEIIGYDKARDCYSAHTYYNNGVTNQWELRGQGKTWKLSGAWDMDGQRAQVRCTIQFDPSGDHNSALWEISQDGSNWQTFWKIQSQKVKQTAKV